MKNPTEPSYISNDPNDHEKSKDMARATEQTSSVRIKLKASDTSRLPLVFRIALLSCLILSFSASITLGDSGTWVSDPANNDWNTAANWSSNTVPDGGFDTATFGFSNATDVSLSLIVNLAGITFNSDAGPYTITSPPGTFLTIESVGLNNESSATQTFRATTAPDGTSGGFQFFVTAGTNTVFINDARAIVGGSSGNLQFVANASAGSATIVNRGGIVSGAGGGETYFFNQTNGGTATIINEAGLVSGAIGGLTWLLEDVATAGSSSITAGGATVSGAFGGITRFDRPSTAGNATLLATAGSNGGAGGVIEFLSGSKGGSARIELFGNGTMDMSTRDGDLSTGSIEGDGVVLFGGGNNLKLGNNNLETIFGGFIEGSGSLTKIGTGTFTLTAANTYTGATTVSGGAVLLNNTTGSATGIGPVKVSLGILGGNGIIGGPVTIGTGSGAGAILAPAFGSVSQKTITLQNSLTLQADGTYTYTFRGNKRRTQADQVIANSVTINGATIAISGTTQGRLKRGSVLTLISNTSANPISGRFSNLADGAVITIGSNHLQASYSGGDGNDLTLTVVP
jgi:autotransporter-associated beta strand protein